MGVIRRALLVVVLVGLGPGSAAAQLPPDEPVQSPRRGGRPGPLTNEEVYQLLDAFVMTQAQSVLQMPAGDPQFAEFYRRMTHLQAVQRRHRNQRQRVLNELRRLVGPDSAAPDESAVEGKIKELDDLEAQFQSQERQALVAIDMVLQPRQRARFRIFLENMERRKVDLLMRARQGRGQQPPAGRAPIR